jgi:hypothetical protein
MEGWAGLALGGLAMAVLAAVLGAAGSGHRAMLHHPPDPFRNPLLENGILRSPLAWPDIFTSRLLLTSGGDCLPVGCATFAAINMASPANSPRAWHVALAAIHLLTAAIAFAILCPLAGALQVRCLATACLLLPFLAQLSNDVNFIGLSLGILLLAVACCTGSGPGAAPAPAP